MIDLLRNKVAEYVTRNADINNWESVREMFGAYSYLAFLCMATYKDLQVDSIGYVIKIATLRQLEIPSILEEICQISECERFALDVIRIMQVEHSIDIEKTYQEFLSVDFTLKDGTIVFESGKNNRDVLGSYYTQKEFAEIIASKAFYDYKLSNGVNTKKIVVADYSCGSSIFLLAACDLCETWGFEADIYGYDVDPIAVLISRVKLVSPHNNNNINVKIYLGNPLLPSKGNCVEKFKKALAGRYYNENMGINPVKNVDIILGNPPWEKVRFEEKKFLHHFYPDGDVGTKTERDRLIHSVSRHNSEFYYSLIRDYEECKNVFKTSELFRQSSCGEINTYALFTELSRKMIGHTGIVSLIIKSSLVKMPVYKDFFKELTCNGELYNLYLFSNRNKIFNIDSREEFAVIYMSHMKRGKLQIALDLDDYNKMNNCDMITLSYEDLTIINPETGMIPNIKSTADLQFLVKMSKRNRTFGEVFPNCRFGRLVHLTNHSKMIKKELDDGYIPIYEGKFIELYTSKYATFKGMKPEEKYKNKASANTINNPRGDEYPESRYFIKKDTWENLSKNFERKIVIAWRSLTSATNRRTMLATVLPLMPTCQSIQLLQLEDERKMLHILALFNSIVFDYIVRLKMVGLDLTQTIVKQIPVPSMEQFDEIIEMKGISAPASKHIISRLKALYADDERVTDLFSNFDTYEVEEDWKTIIAELDHIIGHLYGIKDDELKRMASTFGAFYNSKELATYFL